jgi:hypothetical protein
MSEVVTDTSPVESSKIPQATAMVNTLLTVAGMSIQHNADYWVPNQQVGHDSKVYWLSPLSKKFLLGRYHHPQLVPKLNKVTRGSQSNGYEELGPSIMSLRKDVERKFLSLSPAQKVAAILAGDINTTQVLGGKQPLIENPDNMPQDEQWAVVVMDILNKVDEMMDNYSDNNKSTQHIIYLPFGISVEEYKLTILARLGLVTGLPVDNDTLFNYYNNEQKIFSIPLEKIIKKRKFVTNSLSPSVLKFYDYYANARGIDRPHRTNHIKSVAIQTNTSPDPIVQRPAPQTRPKLQKSLVSSTEMSLKDNAFAIAGDRDFNISSAYGMHFNGLRGYNNPNLPIAEIMCKALEIYSTFRSPNKGTQFRIIYGDVIRYLESPQALPDLHNIFQELCTLYQAKDLILAMITGFNKLRKQLLNHNDNTGRSTEVPRRGKPARTRLIGDGVTIDIMYQGDIPVYFLDPKVPYYAITIDDKPQVNRLEDTDRKLAIQEVDISDWTRELIVEERKRKSGNETVPKGNVYGGSDIDIDIESLTDE